MKDGNKPEAIQADLAMAKAIFPAYAERWGRDDGKRKWVEVEQVFDVRGPPLGVRLRGKIDGAFEDRSGKLWILETKTASQISEDTLSQALAFDFQSLFYCHALEAKLKRPVVGVLYNVVRVPQIGKAMDKSSDAYVEAVRADVSARPDFYFARFELTYPRKVRERFAEELTAKLQEFIGWIARDLPTYKNESACRARWTCNYLPVCACGGDPAAAGFKQNRELFSELKED